MYNQLMETLPGSLRVMHASSGIFNLPQAVTRFNHSNGTLTNPFQYAAEVMVSRLRQESARQGYSNPWPIIENMADFQHEMEIARNLSTVSDPPIGPDIKEAKNILVVAYLRTGSTLLGELINSYPGVFYTFEPFHMMSTDPYSSLKLLREAFRCNFNDAYTRHRQIQSYSFLDANFRWYSVCKNIFGQSTACQLPEYMNSICLKHPIRLIKAVRLEALYLETILTHFGSSLKIIYLTRDPRGVMSSRWNRGWCTDDCSSIYSFCQALNNDLTIYEDLKIRYPDQVYLRRYEDLVLDLYNQSKLLFDFLELRPDHPFAENFINIHTDGKHSDPSYEKNLEGTLITFKEPKKVVFQWQQKLSSSQIKSIQDACSEPMTRLGYRIIDNFQEGNTSTTERSSDMFNPLNTPLIDGFV